VRRLFSVTGGRQPRFAPSCDRPGLSDIGRKDDCGFGVFRGKLRVGSSASGVGGVGKMQEQFFGHFRCAIGSQSVAYSALLRALCAPRTSRAVGCISRDLRAPAFRTPRTMALG